MLYPDIPRPDAPVIYTGAFPILTAWPGSICYIQWKTISSNESNNNNNNNKPKAKKKTINKEENKKKSRKRKRDKYINFGKEMKKNKTNKNKTPNKLGDKNVRRCP